MAEPKSIKEDEQGIGKEGLAAIGFTTAAAIAGRTPLGRTAKGLYRGIQSLLKKTQPPVPQSSTAIKSTDEVVQADEIAKTNLPDVVDEKVLALQSQQRKLIENEKKYYENLRTRAQANPLSSHTVKHTFDKNNASYEIDDVLDSDLSRNGSFLYDMVALAPQVSAKGGYQLPAQAWADYFKTAIKKPITQLKFKTNVVDGDRTTTQTITPFEKYGKRASLSRDELTDTNIAYFDDKGNLTGGYLYFAKLNDQKVSASTLLDMVQNSPAGRTKSVSLGNVPEQNKFAQEYFDEVEQTFTKIKAGLDQISSAKMGTSQALVGRAQEESFDRVANFFQKQARKYLSDKVDYQLEFMGDVTKRSTERADKKFKQLIDSAQEIKEDFDNIGIPFKETFTQLGKRAAPFFNRLVDYQERVENFGLVKNAQMHDYRRLGVEDYGETYVYFPGAKTGAATGENIFDADQGFHFSRLTQDAHYGNMADNMYYHIRYGTRSVEGNVNSKVLVLDELQADVSQAAQKLIKNPFVDTKRINPINANMLGNLYKDRRTEKFTEIQEIMDSGLLDKKNYQKYLKASDEFKEIKKQQADFTTGTADYRNIIKQYNETARQAGQSGEHFQPMQQKNTGFGAHGLKFLAKKAIKEGYDYIGLNPSEAVYLAKRSDIKMGSLNFYGNAKGKAGYDRYSIGGELTNKNQDAELPGILKRLAKQYNTEAKTIRVSKSDPTKEYKLVVERRTPKFGNETFENLQDEHIGAFKTFSEADFARNERSFQEVGNVEIEQILAEDPANYFEIFALKITPEMFTKPFTLYKSTGGLVVDIFKW